jgi:protein PsiE
MKFARKYYPFFLLSRFLACYDFASFLSSPRLKFMTDEPKHHRPLLTKINDYFETLILAIQALALVMITITTGVAIIQEGISMYTTGTAGLADLLQLFLFIAILSMVRQYSLGQRELKLRTPVVITIVAVARYLIVNMDHLTSKFILLTSVSILILTLALYIARNIRGLYSSDNDRFDESLLKGAGKKLKGLIPAAPEDAVESKPKEAAPAK